MNIPAINQTGSILGFKIQGKKWEALKNFASMVCSRESTYRTALDISAFDFPTLLADIFRGPKKFLESVFEAASATLSIGLSPYINSMIAKLIGKFILPKDMQKDTLNYLQFNMDELEDFEKFKKAAADIKEREVQDKKFIASLYSNKNKSEHYLNQAKEIEKFCDNFEGKATEEKMKLAYKLKKGTIIGESILEGGWWGSFGLVMRAFRKYILKEDRFTGTKGYVSDTESQQIGEAGDLTLWQKIAGAIFTVIAPLCNIFLLNKVEDKKTVTESKILTKIKENFDLTHGIYPKLGLLFSITSYPKWIGMILTSQGNFERVERFLKLITVLPSWWMGHRVTNGVLARKADKELQEKYNIKGGILVEENHLNQKFPEPARIHHVMQASKENPQLQAEAESKHAECLYNGFILHSLLVLAVNMGVNYITKLRAEKALGR